MSLEKLYPDHVRERQRRAEAALAASGFEALVLHAGTIFTYFADDQHAPFHANPHFASWTPIEGPHHLLAVRPGRKPLLVRVRPDDFWYEQTPPGNPFWAGEFDLKEALDEEAAWKLAAPAGRAAYVGDAPERARSAGIAELALNPEALVAHLDWDRAVKTAYEVACIEEATRRAARGHAAARKAFEAGGSELEIHHAYVEAVGCTDEELPYHSIVALDEKGATLHYQNKRTLRDGKVLLIDSGATCNGYASDITRTWTRKGCEPLFVDLVRGMDALQRGLCDLARPGIDYPELQREAHRRIGELLRESGVLRVGGSAAFDLGLTKPFFPHGVGHFLGIQVHDVGGKQRSPDGGTKPAPEGDPYLRTTRSIEEGMVFTVEPGVYFIPMLLGPLREGEHADKVDWRLVERLAPCGGVRIEDNVVVTERGHRNLTRPHVG